MKDFKSLVTHPLVLASLGVVVVIAVGSGFYYVSSTRVPTVSTADTATTTELSVTGSGTVEPAQNPDLAFESGGRVARVSVAVGDAVSQGEVLASLDTSALSAQRAQAAANLKSQQAKLDEMNAGARQVDVDAKQTAVAQAQLALANEYQTISSSLNDAYGQSYDAVHADTDTLFNNPNTTNSTLVFTSADNQSSTQLVNERTGLNTELAAWNQELSPLSASSPAAQLETSLASSLTHLLSVRNYAGTALQALNGAVVSSSFNQTSITAALASAAGMRNTVNGLITSLQNTQQTLSSEKLAVQSAEDALNQTLAGSTPQDIEAQQAQVDAAQASVANVDAQISNAVVVAPFAGTVASVHVKTGDIVPPNTSAISLNPKSALQIAVYFSEIDVTKVKTGAQAQVTLDAYGSSRIFPAQVVSVDTSPSADGEDSTGYKVVLQFAQSDPAISSGMTANVTIPAAE